MRTMWIDKGQPRALVRCGRLLFARVRGGQLTALDAAILFSGSLLRLFVFLVVVPGIAGLGGGCLRGRRRTARCIGFDGRSVRRLVLCSMGGGVGLVGIARTASCMRAIRRRTDGVAVVRRHARRCRDGGVLRSDRSVRTGSAELPASRNVQEETVLRS